MAVASKGFGELFAEKKSALDNFQKDLASIIPAFPGMPSAKFFDLGIGIDAHPTMFPPSPLLPVPHIGMVFDIMGAIMAAIATALPEPPPPPEPEGDEPAPPQPVTLASVATAVANAMKPSVQVHGRWISNAGTSIQHLPGIILHALPAVSPMASSEMFMGSSTVLADSSPFSSQFHPALSCNLVGMPAPFRMTKPKAKVSLMLPTSLLSILTSGGKPVLVGGPPTIDLFQLMFKLGLKGLGKLVKRGGKAAKKLLKKVAKKNPKLAKILKKAKCRLFGEPVDAATGRVYANNMDFDLAGPIPLIWERTYYSNAEIEGSLGYNWHHSYHIGIYDMENGFFTLRMSDGRETALPVLNVGETFYDGSEQFRWSNTDEGYCLQDSSGLNYYFSSPKNREGFRMVSRIADNLDHEIRFNYDARGYLSRIIDSGERTIHIESNQKGYITRVYTQHNGDELNLVSYGYDALGNMNETSDALGNTKHFLYNGHLLVQLTGPTGMSFYWEYEGSGDDARCIHTWGDGGILEYWTRYEPGKTTATDSLGHSTTYFYDEDHLIYQIVDAKGGITHQHYNDVQELELVVDPEGNSTKMSYNEDGLLVKYTNGNGESTNYTYNLDGLLEQVRSPEGAEVGWEYDEKDRLISKTNVDGSVLSYNYSDQELTSIVDQEGNEYSFLYDLSHNLTQLRLPNDAVQRWKYDDLGRLIEEIDSKGYWRKYSYDAAGQLISMAEANGNVHSFSYDRMGNMIRAFDGRREVDFTYGALGTLLSRRQEDRRVSFHYDTELQLKGITNEGDEAYRFALDPLGDVVGEWGFDGLQKRYERDGVGRVLKVLRPAERWTAYQYDSVGNVVKEDHSDGTAAAYGYTKDGQLKEALNDQSHIFLKRDKAGRVVEEQQGQHQITRSYDEQGNCAHIGSSLGASIALQHDEMGYLTGLEALGSAEDKNAWSASWKRDKEGLEIQQVMSGGVSQFTERDIQGRIVRQRIGVGNAEQSRTRYEWDNLNKLKLIENEISGTQSLFKYDLFDNLISASYKTKGQSVEETIYRVPDKIGNLYKTPRKSDRHYGKGGRLLEDDKYHFHYDAEGNLIFKEFKQNVNIHAVNRIEQAKVYGLTLKASQTGWVYKWSGNGMLEKVSSPAGNVVSFVYDALGRRIAKTCKGRIRRWIWDGNVPLHEWEYEGDFPPGSAVDDSGELREEPELVESPITWIYEEGSFVPSARLEGDRKYSILADHLGTPTRAYDEHGSLVWERELDCYGALRKETGIRGLVPQLYQGQYIDEETGLAYNRFRYYDPEVGNYISQDPIGLAGGLALYGYVHDTNDGIDIFGLSGGSVASGWNEFQSKTKGWFGSRTEASTGWKVYKESSQSVKELAIGRLPDTEAAEKIGMRRLNTSGWTPAVNDAWMQGGIDANKTFHLASDNIPANRLTPPGSRFPTTVFDRELLQLEAAGYSQHGNKMKPKTGHH